MNYDFYYKDQYIKEVYRRTHDTKIQYDYYAFPFFAEVCDTNSLKNVVEMSNTILLQLRNLYKVIPGTWYFPIRWNIPTQSRLG